MPFILERGVILRHEPIMLLQAALAICVIAWHVHNAVWMPTVPTGHAVDALDCLRFVRMLECVIHGIEAPTKRRGFQDFLTVVVGLFELLT